MARVELGKKIPGEQLEKILVKVARELRLKTTFEDKHETTYRLGSRVYRLVSIKKEGIYEQTYMELKKRVSTIAIIGFDRKDSNASFDIYSVGREELIEEYLEAVSKRI